MARILVTGDTTGIAARTLLERLVEQIREDGHDAALAGGEDPAQEIRDSDALVSLLDVRGDPGPIGLVAFAYSQKKPVLGCIAAGATLPKALRQMCTQVAEVRRASELPPALGLFYAKVRPFAGRLVRDKVPALVQEAGHDVKFRQLGKEDLPRFLKRKILEEAEALESSAGSREKEEMADLLEALEALITARGYQKDDLRSVKNHKLTTRGGFSEGFVVESASTSARETEAKSEGAKIEPPAKSTSPQDEKPVSKPTTSKASKAKVLPIGKSKPAQQEYEGPAWEASDEAVEPVQIEAVGPESDLEPELRDL